MKRALMLAALCAVPARAQDIAKDGIPADQFGKLHAIIKPQAGEFAWYEEIPWVTSVQEAREKASAQGKPIVIWCSADGQPCGAS